jgi:hypothetical protein
MGGKSAAAAGQVANTEFGLGNRIAAEADLALKTVQMLSQFNPQSRASFHRTYARGSLSEPTP